MADPSPNAGLPDLLGNSRQFGAMWRVLSIPFLVFLIFPLVALILRTTPTEILEHLGREQTQQAVLLSLRTSLTTTLITITLGLPLAYWLSQRRFFLKRLIDTIVDLPTVLPPSVAGVGLLLAFGRRGVLGEALESVDIHIAFTTVAVIMAQTFVAAPYFIRSATLGFSAVDTELKQAAALDGANEWQVFSSLILPLSTSAIITGSALSWARALGEFGATIIFAGNFPGRTQTMPLAIYLGFELDLDVAITLSVILLAFSFTTLLLIKGFFRRE